jgi:guanylate kinase
MNIYMHPDELEEIEYQLNGRADYLSEAFGAEARLLAAQGEDEHIEECGYASRQGMQAANRVYRAKLRCAAAIRRNHAAACLLPSDDVPF